MAVLSRPNFTTIHLDNRDETEDNAAVAPEPDKDATTRRPLIPTPIMPRGGAGKRPFLSEKATLYKGREVSGKFRIQVLSIAAPAMERIRHSNTLRPVAWFRRAANLKSEAGLIALVEPEVGRGPFHLVVDELPPQPARTVHIHTSARYIRMGPWILDLSNNPEVWDPRPPWDGLQLLKEQVTRLRTRGAAAARAHSSSSSFVPLLLGRSIQCVEDLEDALTQVTYRSSHLKEAVASISGLGPGLTPAGDDFLVGIIFALWATHHPRATSLATEICRTAASRTTWLSRAYLGSAAQGYADEKWHHLLHALSHDDQAALDRAALSAVSFGATSGLDTLSGFLWALSLPICRITIGHA